MHHLDAPNSSHSWQPGYQSSPKQQTFRASFVENKIHLIIHPALFNINQKCLQKCNGQSQGSIYTSNEARLSLQSQKCGIRQQTRAESPRSSPYHDRLQPGDQLTQARLQAALVPLHFLQGSVFQYLEYIQDATWIMGTSTLCPHPFCLQSSLDARTWTGHRHPLTSTGATCVLSALRNGCVLWSEHWRSPSSTLRQDLSFNITVAHMFHTSLWQTGSGFFFRKKSKLIHQCVAGERISLAIGFATPDDQTPGLN